MMHHVARSQIKNYLADYGLISNEMIIDQDIQLALHGNRVNLSPTVTLTYDLTDNAFDVRYA